VDSSTTIVIFIHTWIENHSEKVECRVFLKKINNDTIEAKSSTTTVNHYSNRNTCCIGTLVITGQRQRCIIRVKRREKEKIRRSRLSIAREERKKERKKERRQKKT
jgi:hypothetical protein